VGAIFITAITFAISVVWSSLHATIGNGLRLSSGDAGRDNVGP
jgi:hypothetical protein